MAWHFGRRPALITCGVLQTASLLLYLACAFDPGDHRLIYAASTAEHLLGGAATVALFTLMMDASDPNHAGTDYTLLACAIVFATGLAGLGGGLVGDAAGYAGAFGLSVLLSGLGCLALVLGLDRGQGPGLADRLQGEVHPGDDGICGGPIDNDRTGHPGVVVRYG